MVAGKSRLFGLNTCTNHTRLAESKIHEGLFSDLYFQTVPVEQTLEQADYSARTETWFKIISMPEPADAVIIHATLCEEL